MDAENIASRFVLALSDPDDYQVVLDAIRAAYAAGIEDAARKIKEQAWKYDNLEPYYHQHVKNALESVYRALAG